MKIIFAGTPVFAAKALEALQKTGFDIILALTQPDRPAGRGMRLQASPVKILAQQYDIPLLQPETLKSPDTQAQLETFKPDVMVVAAYGLLLPEAVLRIPHHGCINIHASLLPRWRGAAPIQRALLEGDAETGVSIMQMDEGLDTGAVLLQRAFSIGPHDTTASLHDKLADLGSKCIVEALTLLDQGKLTSTPQNNAHACYAVKIRKIEAEIDWTHDAAHIDRMIRTFNPHPGAFTHLHGTMFKLWQADIVTRSNAHQAGEIMAADHNGIVVACGRDALSINILQKAGGRKLAAAPFLAGHPLQPGECFQKAAQDHQDISND
ncbi:methionyl-tRNA formyltransferase [Nitrosomonas sp. HPC101]|uniref:methionyl-tRNA formyltransferase n=1 Tax=Nitrosomonas sp. HPC101 TaxID=1658667 RepID=UPI00136BC1C0|nr:methionyl-tRNA formyltransferase [Nitrosomonas sp. HPC101]MXS84823.1 methionyl-tRNA formyltransferase [Nitrosomonas sp. HPC101]